MNAKAMVCIRDILAFCIRTLPRSLRGRGFIAHKVHRFFTAGKEPFDKIRTVRFKDGYRLILDLTSRTEWFSFYTGDYDSNQIKWATSIIQPDWVVLDVGANIGFWSIALGCYLKRSQGNGKILAFEPVPSNFNRLQKNIALNKIECIVQAFQTALGAEKGIIRLGKDNYSETGDAVILQGNVSSWSTMQEVTAQIQTLDNVYAENRNSRCDFIKVDIEGYEIPFLRGGAKIIREHRPIILGEFNTDYMKDYNYSFEDLSIILQGLDYQWFLFEKNKLVPWNGKKKVIQDLALIPKSRFEQITAFGLQYF